MHLKLSRKDYINKVGKKILGKDECPFCDPDESINKLVWKWDFWNVVVNMAPYTWNDNHIMATPKKHKKFFYELDENELLELKKVHEFVKEYYNGWEYFSATRESFWNRSVEHYHTHFFPGKMQEKYIIEMLENQNLVNK